MDKVKQEELFSLAKTDELQNGITLGETTEQLPRIDTHPEIKQRLLSLCRLSYGEIWQDPVRGHRVGVLDATKSADVLKIMGNEKCCLVINDPPYNVKVGNTSTTNLSKIALDKYISFSQKWVRNALEMKTENF